MKKILFFLSICMLLVACTDKRQGQIAKVLFLLNRTGTYYERSNADSRQCYLNVDSLLDCIDTTNIKTSKGARAFPIVQPLLDSLCTTEELCELTSRSYSAAFVLLPQMPWYVEVCTFRRHIAFELYRYDEDRCLFRRCWVGRTCW